MNVMTVRDAFKDALTKTSLFKVMSFGVIPPPTQIKKFPAIAIDMVETKFDRRSGCSFWANSTVDIYVYNVPPLRFDIHSRIHSLRYYARYLC